MNRAWTPRTSVSSRDGLVQAPRDATPARGPVEDGPRGDTVLADDTFARVLRPESPVRRHRPPGMQYCDWEPFNGPDATVVVRVHRVQWKHDLTLPSSGVWRSRHATCRAGLSSGASTHQRLAAVPPRGAPHVVLAYLVELIRREASWRYLVNSSSTSRGSARRPDWSSFGRKSRQLNG
jgi:hypothetical protein